MTKIFAVMMVKDELDIIEHNIDYLETQDIDHIFVANNLSSDGTGEKLIELSGKYGNITVYDDNEFAYYQPDKMNEWICRCYKLNRKRGDFPQYDAQFYVLMPHCNILFVYKSIQHLFQIFQLQV